MVSVIVNVTVSPTLGVALSTDWLSPRSASWGVTVAAALLLLGLGSAWSAALMLAVLVLAFGLTTWAVRTSWGPGPEVPTVPTVHRPVALA